MRMRTTGFQRLIYTSSLWFLSAVFDQFHAGLTLPVQFCSLLMNVCPVSLVQKDKLSVCDKSFVWTLIIINDKKLLGLNYKHFGPEQEEAEKMEKLSSLRLAKQHLSFSNSSSSSSKLNIALLGAQWSQVLPSCIKSTAWQNKRQVQNVDQTLASTLTL